jgi:nucleotide-binding universal stress UspA family protein
MPPFRRLLVPIDLSPGSERVVERVPLLPLSKRARIVLLHVVPKSLSRDSRIQAENDARKALQLVAKRIAPKLPKGASVRPVVKVGGSAAEIAKHAQSMKAELLVMGRGRRRALHDAFIGSTAERVIRQGQLPVLVVRLTAHGPYRHPLLALDIDEAAHDVVALALRVIPPPGPRFSVAHAFEAPYEDLIYSSLTPEQSQRYRDHHRAEALRKITQMVGSVLAEAKISRSDELSWKSYVRHGSPRIVVPKILAKTRADLLVLGTHGYSGVAHAFLGTIAGDLLRKATCDVLVVPPVPPHK